MSYHACSPHIDVAGRRARLTVCGDRGLRLRQRAHSGASAAAVAEAARSHRHHAPHPRPSIVPTTCHVCSCGLPHTNHTRTGLERQRNSGTTQAHKGSSSSHRGSSRVQRGAVQSRASPRCLVFPPRLRPWWPARCSRDTSTRRRQARRPEQPPRDTRRGRRARRLTARSAAQRWVRAAEQSSSRTAAVRLHSHQLFFFLHRTVSVASPSCQRVGVVRRCAQLDLLERVGQQGRTQRG